MRKVIFSLPLFPLLLVDCSSCPQDPTQAEFFCGVRNITTGTYARRQEILQHEAMQAQLGAWQSGQQANARQAQATALAQQRNELRAKLAALNADLGRERQQLLRARAERFSDRQTLAELETRIRGLQGKRDQLAQADPDDPVSQEELEAIRQENARLKEQIEGIYKLPKAE
jgi:chromosome segregation ATPase